MLQYHFKRNDGPDLGPIGVEEFRQRQETGEINDATMVWRSGMLDWTTYGVLRDLDQRAAQPRNTPPPLPKKKAVTVAASPKAGFLACGTCNQEWPESLLTVQDGRKICGNCQNKRLQAIKEGRVKKGEGSSLGAWFLMIGAIVCAGCLAYKVTHYGIRLPKEKAQELTAPSTYGK